MVYSQAVRLRFFILRLGNKYVYYIPVEVAILLGFFKKKSSKIATSKKEYQSYYLPVIKHYFHIITHYQRIIF